MKAQEEMQIMARELCRTLDVRFDPDGGRKKAQDGVWFIERADTQTALYRLTCGCGPDGGVDPPLSSTVLTAQGMADALYYARRALEYFS